RHPAACRGLRRRAPARRSRYRIHLTEDCPLYVLGINAYHGGASACLIRNGELIAAVEEERFSRIKYQAGFPVQAIRYVLAEAGIEPQDLDHIGISRKPTANLMKKALFAFRRRPSVGLIKDRLQNSMKVGDLKSVFGESLGVEP